LIRRLALEWGAGFLGFWIGPDRAFDLIDRRGQDLVAGAYDNWWHDHVSDGRRACASGRGR
jgi:hypothetical protein